MEKTLRETRDVVVTNGPFLRVEARGQNVAAIGGTVRARAGHVAVAVTIESAPWIEVRRVKIVRASNRDVPKEIEVTPRANAAGAMIAKATFDLAVTGDDAFIVIASGDKTPRRSCPATARKSARMRSRVRSGSSRSQKSVAPRVGWTNFRRTRGVAQPG